MRSSILSSFDFSPVSQIFDNNNLGSARRRKRGEREIIDRAQDKYEIKETKESWLERMKNRDDKGNEGHSI